MREADSVRMLCEINVDAKCGAYRGVPDRNTSISVQPSKNMGEKNCIRKIFTRVHEGQPLWQSLHILLGIYCGNTVNIILGNARFRKICIEIILAIKKKRVICARDTFRFCGSIYKMAIK